MSVSIKVTLYGRLTLVWILWIILYFVYLPSLIHFRSVQLKSTIEYCCLSTLFCLQAPSHPNLWCSLQKTDTCFFGAFWPDCVAVRSQPKVSDKQPPAISFRVVSLNSCLPVVEGTSKQRRAQWPLGFQSLASLLTWYVILCIDAMTSDWNAHSLLPTWNVLLRHSRRWSKVGNRQPWWQHK